ncbi:scaffold attachment factor B2-like isoform X2 [Physella acuta]|nr:scaffold attachment factor B2-like isoform X2 [Physella acuta]XP_059169020.1 scaffold attachment factor B2-like isoform X2 [Physella acuta]
MPRTKQSARGKKRGRRAAKGSEEVDDKMEVETSDQADSETVKQLDESQTSEVADESHASEVADESHASEVADESHASEVADESHASEVADESHASEVADESQAFETADESINLEQGNGSVCKDTEAQEVNENDNTKIDEGREDSEENTVKETQDNGCEINANSNKEDMLVEEGIDENFEKSEEKKIDKPEEVIIPYKPHTFPDFSSLQLIEKWEWHIRIFPIDQADIRTCVLESVSKIAQETWFYIDKKNYGMGAFDLCLRSTNDAAMVMLKTLHAPMTYRYVTIQVNRRAKNKEQIEKIRAKASLKEKTENETDDDEVEEEIEKMPYTEVEETATLLLDYYHTPTFEKIKGKEKKRSLFVKYLPESTSKELLNVLFPVANNLDIIKTGKGRRVGDLNVTSASNVPGICNSYIAIHINGDERICLDWKEENIDDGVQPEAYTGESPWEILPRTFEIEYEMVPDMHEDETIQYRKRKREMEIENRKNRPKLDGRRSKDNNRSKPDRPKAEMNRSRPDGNRGKEVVRSKTEGIRPLLEGLKGEKRERRSRWDKVPVAGADVIKLQMEMNEKIQSQLALLQSVTAGVIPSLMDAPILGGRSRDTSRKDKKRDRGNRFRKASESSRVSDDSRHSRERALDRKERSRDRERRDSHGRSSPPSRMGRFDIPVHGGHFGGGRSQSFMGYNDRERGGRFSDYPADSYGFRNRYDDMGGGPMDDPRGFGQFDDMGRGRFEPRGGGFFEPPARGGNYFDSPARGGLLDNPVRGGGHLDNQGRGGHFGNQGRGRFDQSGRGGGRFDHHGRGSGSSDKSGRGSNAESTGRGGSRGDRGRGGGFENRNRGGGGYENRGRGKNFGRGASAGGQQNFGGQNFGNQQTAFGYPNNYGNQNNNYTPQNSYSSRPTYNQQGSFGNQQANQMPTQQTDYNTQPTQQTDYNSQQTPQTGYSTQAIQQNVYTNQAYGNQQATYDQTAWGQQAYGTQQTYGSAGTTLTDGYWGQTDYTAQSGTATSNTPAVGQQQDYTASYGQQANNQATSISNYAYNTQSMGNVSANAADYSADAAFANQGFYTANPVATGVTDGTYGAYSTQDPNAAYGTTQQQSNLTTAYNFAQYPSSS